MFKPRVYIRAKFLIVLLALLMLSLPASAQSDNCCGIDRQCSTKDEWVAGYYAFQNNQCAAPAEQQQGQQARQQRSPLAINNCCFGGWQCEADEEWISGYWAFQNDHCASRSHWEEQMRKREAADASSNQQAQSSEQWQRRNSSQHRQNNNQPTQQNSNQPQVKERQSESESVLIHVTNYEYSEQESSSGAPVAINHGTNEQKCRWFPMLDECQYPELYD